MWQLLEGHQPQMSSAIVRSRKAHEQELPCVTMMAPQMAAAFGGDRIAEVTAVGSYVLKEMNRDLFVELTSYFA